MEILTGKNKTTQFARIRSADVDDLKDANLQAVLNKDVTSIFNPSEWKGLFLINEGYGRQARKLFWMALLSLLLILLPILYLLYAIPKNSSVLSNSSSLKASANILNDSAKKLYTTGDQAALKEFMDSRQALIEDAKRVDRLGFSKNTREMRKLIDEIDKQAGILVKNQDALLEMGQLSQNMAKTMPRIVNGYEKVAQRLADSGLAGGELSKLSRQATLAERLMREIGELTAGQNDVYKVATQLSSSRLQFEAVLNGHMGQPDGEASNLSSLGGDIANQLTEINRAYQQDIAPHVLKILSQSMALGQTKDAIAAVNSHVILLQSKLKAIESSSASLFKFIIAMAVLVMGFLTLFLSMFRFRQLREKIAKIEEEKNAVLMRNENELKQRQIERNDAAILRLMGELADLADGDLTTNATVSEDFTGAIADAVNYAIEQLRHLVQAINITASGVVDSASNTQATAFKLTSSAEKQYQEIEAVSQAINGMAESIDGVSRNAIESSSVAEKSVALSQNGGDLVRRNIDGMDQIRDQIQETAKRIKRLGESSQEIGNIVALINDITDQTNILALNAAIQASMAGEAGRGFAVVADEVQRLAERSVYATKEIEALVKTIQSDTNEAVISMEHTTAEVVRGAKLSKEAGSALDEVQRVSKSLADLIQNISNAARRQAVSASNVAETMKVIQEITVQNRTGATETAKAVGNLSDIANALKQSVAGFKLPESHLDHLS